MRQAGGASLNFMLMDWYKAAIIPIMNLSLTHHNTTASNDSLLSQKRKNMLSSFLSGGLAGGTSTTLLYPIEFLRTRLALDVGKSTSVSEKPMMLGSKRSKNNTSTESTLRTTRKYPGGMKDVFTSIWKTDGIRGMYQGYGIALSGVVLYRALHLGGFDACKEEVVYRRKQSLGYDDRINVSISIGEKFAIAQIVSIVAGTICYPIDSVRRRLMMQAGMPQNERLYTGSIHAFRRIYVDEGMRGFYLGFGPNLIRTVGGAVVLVAYDMFSDYLSSI